jgi:hypothetical protein
MASIASRAACGSLYWPPRAVGHTPRIHEWEIPGGGDIAAWMEARHDAADHIFCIVSSAYLAKPYSAWERRAAQWAAVTDRPNFAVPVFVEPCKAPTLFAHLKHCDLYGLSEADARPHLKTFLEPAATPPREIFPRGAKAFSGWPALRRRFPARPLSNVPIAVPLHFMGREGACRYRDGAPARRGRRRHHCAARMRGVNQDDARGRLCGYHRSDYRATWWIRARRSPLRADLAGLGIRLGWIGADEEGRSWRSRR